jgi:polysaccharide biosynthesis protein PslA
MSANLEVLPGGISKTAAGVAAQPAVAGSLDRRSPLRQGSRGDKLRFSPAIIVRVTQFFDLMFLLLGGLLAKTMLAPLPWPHSDGALFQAALIGTVVTLISLRRSQAYLLRSLMQLGTALRHVFLALTIGGGCMIVALFLTNDAGPGFRDWSLCWLVVCGFLLTASRSYLSRMLNAWSCSGRLARRVAVIGAGEFSKEFIARLRSEPNAYTIVGLYDDRMSRIPGVQEGVRVRGTVNDLLARSREEQIDLIVIALPLRAVERIARILEQVGSAVADICLTTDFAGYRYKSSEISTVGANPVILVGEQPLKEWRAATKTAFDIVVGAIALLMLSPMMLLIALGIRLESPGPILFRQPRMGFNNRLFTCYKFRSMYTGMTDLLGDKQATRDDPRVTKLGKWLRALSLDELPQLFNVLQGNMSLVGPRPHPPNTKAADKLFTDVVANYAFRHRVKPGMTGWAQVNGWRGETKTVEQIENRVACDLAYIDNWSVWFDLKIIGLTITREIFSSTAF